MDASVIHEVGQQHERGRVAGWQEGDRDPPRVTEHAERQTLDTPSLVSVSIDWSASLSSSSAYLDRVEVATKNYVASYGMALSHALAQAGTPADRLDISAAASCLAHQAGPPTIYVEVRGRARGLDQAGFESIARQAEQASTIWNALLGAYWPGTPDVRLNVILVEPGAPELAAERSFSEAAPRALPHANGTAAPKGSPASGARPQAAHPVANGTGEVTVTRAPEPVAPHGVATAAPVGQPSTAPRVLAVAARPGGPVVSTACSVGSPALPSESARAASSNGAGFPALDRLDVRSPETPETPETARTAAHGAWARWMACLVAVVLVGGLVVAQGAAPVPDVVVVHPVETEPLVTADSPPRPGPSSADLATISGASLPPHDGRDAGLGEDRQTSATTSGPALAVPDADGLFLRGGRTAAAAEAEAGVAPSASLQPTPEPEPAQAARSSWGAAASPAGSLAVESPARAEVAFASRPSGWPENQDSTAWLANDGYHLAARHPGRFVSIRAPLEGLFRDVVVSGTFRKIGGPAGGGYGLILRDDGRSAGDGMDQGGRYYVFEAGDRGEVGVWRREEDRWVDLLSWTRSEAVRPGAAPNELEVRAVGQRLTFLVNGAVVADLEDSEILEGRVGIFVGGDFNEVAVDRFAVEPRD